MGCVLEERRGHAFSCCLNFSFSSFSCYLAYYLESPKLRTPCPVSCPAMSWNAFHAVICLMVLMQ